MRFGGIEMATDFCFGQAEDVGGGIGSHSLRHGPNRNRKSCVCAGHESVLFCNDLGAARYRRIEAGRSGRVSRQGVSRDGLMVAESFACGE
jgi:hypothetical protein